MRPCSEAHRGKTGAAAAANLGMSRSRSTSDPTAPVSSVAEWRRERLLASGFAPGLASRLAADCRVDLHALLELVDRDCAPDLAARILAPLDDRGWPC
jgi:hypothetical protein